MIFARDYQKPFWRGFFHAVGITAYSLFLAAVLLSLKRLFNGEISRMVSVAFLVFISLLSIALTGYLMFFEPMKRMMRHHFKAAAMLLGSTLGWLFVFLIIFLVGLVLTLPQTPP
jgi:hypothetical protein